MTNTNGRVAKNDLNSENFSIKNHFIHKILNPKTLCVFGANNNLIATMGSMQLRNCIAGGGLNENVYPIHPRLDNVQGFKAYQSVLDLPIVPDLAFIILPPNAVPEVMEECGQKGIKNLIITSGGFRESGPDGVKLSQKIDDLARKYNMRFIGPNCLGVYNGWFHYPEKENAYINTFWIYIPHKRGNISLVSQSGTIAAQTAWHTNQMGVNIGKSISIGNERNIDIVDFLEYFKDDPQTDVIGIYLEEVKRGRKFIQLAQEITPKKPIVAIYAGGSDAANRSIMSHTGSMGGNEKIFEAVFKETGIIYTSSVTEFLYYLRTLSYAQTNNVFPKGRRLGIITDSGGSGSIITKMAEKYDLTVPLFSEELQSKISDLVPPTGSKSNPVDITFFKNYNDFFVKIPKILMKSGEIDCLIFDGIFDFQEVFAIIENSGYPVDKNILDSMGLFFSMVIQPVRKMVQRKSIPLFYSGPQLYTHPLYREFLDNNVDIFDFWDQPTKCMAMLVKYSEYRRKFS